VAVVAASHDPIRIDTSRGAQNREHDAGRQPRTREPGLLSRIEDRRHAPDPRREPEPGWNAPRGLLAGPSAESDTR
jgi:hypothetical protein